MIKKRIPLTVIGGYLGAGKTTLLNHILRHNQGRRLAVIVNDFGKINIDIELIESQDGDKINLANGCICCSLGDSLATTLYDLAQRDDPPEYIIVEASGVADPAKVAQYGHTPGFRLDGVIVLTDAELVRQKARDKYVGETVVHQLQGADVIILNKIDLVTDETRDTVRDWLGEQVPNVRIIEAEQGRVPLALLLGNEIKNPVRSDEDNLEHHHHVEYETWSYTTTVPLNGDVFRTLVEQLPEGVIRAKGILNLTETPKHRTIFQLVGKRWNLKPGDAWDDAPPRSQVVIIGLPGSIDAKWLEQSLGERGH